MFQHAFSKQSLEDLISKDGTWYSIYQLPTDSLFKLVIDEIFDFCVDSASLAKTFKKCIVIMTW